MTLTVPQVPAPRYGQLAASNAQGQVQLQEIVLDPNTAQADALSLRAAIDRAGRNMTKFRAVRIGIALLALVNLPLFFLLGQWYMYGASVVVVVGVHAGISVLNRREPKARERAQREVRHHRDRSESYRKIRDAVRHVIDTPKGMTEHLYLDLLKGQKVLLNRAGSITAVLDASDESNWIVRILHTGQRAA